MDDQTSDGGGSLGWIDPNKYPVPEFGMVLGQINPNECAGPVRSELGYHLLWVEASRPGGSPDIDKHWSQIENIALNKRKAIGLRVGLSLHGKISLSTLIIDGLSTVSTVVFHSCCFFNLF